MSIHLRSRLGRGLIGGACLVALLLIAGCRGEKPLATINGLQVTEKEFGERCASTVTDPNSGGQTVGLQVLGNLISLKVLEKKVRELNVMPSEADVNRRFEALRKQFAFIQPPLDQRLKMQGRSEADFKRDIQDQMIMEAFRFKDIKVTDQEIKQYYDSHLELPNWHLKERARISQIAVTSKQDLQKALGELRSNAPFGTVARALSRDQFAQQEGRVPNWWTKDDLNNTNLPVPQPVLVEAFKLKPQMYSEPIQVRTDPRDPSKAAWVIVKLEEKKPPATMPFDDVKDPVALQAKLEKWQPRQPEMGREVAKLMKEAQIEVTKPEWAEFTRQFHQIWEAQAAGGGAAPPGMGP